MLRRQEPQGVSSLICLVVAEGGAGESVQTMSCPSGWLGHDHDPWRSGWGSLSPQTVAPGLPLGLAALLFWQQQMEVQQTLSRPIYVQLAHYLLAKLPQLAGLTLNWEGLQQLPLLLASWVVPRQDLLQTLLGPQHLQEAQSHLLTMPAKKQHVNAR